MINPQKNQKMHAEPAVLHSSHANLSSSCCSCCSCSCHLCCSCLVWQTMELGEKQVLAGSYTHTAKSLQCLRLTAVPNQNARHDPCPGTDLAKPLSPLETLALTSLDQTIMVLFVFDRIPLERRFPTGLFSWILLTPTNKNAKQALFLVCILQDDKGKKTRSKTRYGKSPASTHMDFGPQAANLPFLGSLVEMIIPALCRSTRKQQQQQLSNQQPQPNTT